MERLREHHNSKKARTQQYSGRKGGVKNKSYQKLRSSMGFFLYIVVKRNSEGISGGLEGEKLFGTYKKKKKNKTLTLLIPKGEARRADAPGL